MSTIIKKKRRFKKKKMCGKKREKGRDRLAPPLPKKKRKT